MRDPSAGETMENQDLSPPSHADASRPSLGFPLGTALLLIVIFSLSGIFSCCYHWEKLRSLRRRSLAADASGAAVSANPAESPPLKSLPPSLHVKQNQSQSMPVLMPGDQIPKFIAFPCPCQPPRLESIVVEVQRLPMKPPPRLPVPLY